jgi:hypothetical protein
MQQCGWKVEGRAQLEFLSSLINRERKYFFIEIFPTLLSENWNCRVAIVPDYTFYVPFAIPVWGVIEASHLHIDNHLNFIFHADSGKVIAAAAYPVRDIFQVTQQGSTIKMHGPVKYVSTCFKLISS